METFSSVKPRLARVFPLTYVDYFLRHDLLMIFMGMWVIVNWWVWPVPDFHFRKLEAMYVSRLGIPASICIKARDACQEPSICVKARDACQAPSICVKARDASQAPSICVKARDAGQAPSVCVKARDACQAPSICVNAIRHLAYVSMPSDT